MEDLPKLLGESELQELEKQGKAVFFNYLGNTNNLPKVSDEDFFKLLKGNSHALLINSLYIKHGNLDYKLEEEDWIKTEEAKKYVPFLFTMRYRGNLLSYIFECLN